MRHLFLLSCVLEVGVLTTLAIVNPKSEDTSTAQEISAKPTETVTKPAVITSDPTTASPEPVTTPELVSATLPVLPLDPGYTFTFYSRAEWGAREPVERTPLDRPQVPYVVVHDSGEPPMIEVAGCFNVTQCNKSLKTIQNQHMDVNGWSDIGYHFAIGGDGAVYEGRGWGIVGAQVKHFNTVSLGICFVGSYTTKLIPTLAQTTALTDLIAAGVRLGFIRSDYRLINHGQIKGTLCPGKKLSKKVLTMAHYSTFPGSLKDLLDVPELPDFVKDEIRNEIVSVSDAM